MLCGFSIISYRKIGGDLLDDESVVNCYNVDVFDTPLTKLVDTFEVTRDVSVTHAGKRSGDADL